MLGIPAQRPRRQVSANDLTEVHEIDLVITSTCNLSGTCTECYLTQGFLHSSQKMSATMVHAIVRWAKQTFGQDRRLTFNLLGGEPTLHPQFLEIIEIITSAGFEVTMVSNGHRSLRFQLAKPITLTGYGQLPLGDSGFIKQIQLSVEAPFAEGHDAIRGPGSFAEVELSAATLRQYGIPFGINWTIHDDTCGFDLDMVELARQWKANRLNVHVLSIRGTARERANNQLVTPSAWRGILGRMWDAKWYELARAEGPRLVIDCEASYDNGPYIGSGFANPETFILDGLCNVRVPTGITVYPDGATISCPLHAETPELSAYVWGDDGLYYRDSPEDERAIVSAAGDCPGCPLYQGQTIEGHRILCPLTRIRSDEHDAALAWRLAHKVPFHDD
jgi:MoaA/NifB/PqqE/SkfB family radical SAM enzyme